MLDLSAAFDTIDHQILLEYSTGVTKDALLWFKSYLMDKTLVHIVQIAIY
jgi:hypothetical protein